MAKVQGYVVFYRNVIPLFSKHANEVDQLSKRVDFIRFINATNLFATDFFQFQRKSNVLKAYPGMAWPKT